MNPVDSIRTAEGLSNVGMTISFDAVQKSKKYETHCHLGGAWPLRYLQEIASPEDYSQLVQYLQLIEKGIDYHQGFKVFALTAKIVNTDEKVEAGIVALCEQYARDGVERIELRTGLKDLGSGVKGYLNAVLKGIERGARESGIKVDLLLSLRRNTSKDHCEQTVALAINYFRKGVDGMDLSGDSTIGEGDDAIAALKKAKSAGMSVSVHMGESPKESREQQMREIEELAPDRIGHGVFLCDEAIQWVLSRKIPVEMCLTSSCKVGMVESADAHPGLKWLKDGHPVAICTDDPLIFGVSLSDECYQAATLLGWSENDFKIYQERIAGLFFHT